MSDEKEAIETEEEWDGVLESEREEFENMVKESNAAKKRVAAKAKKEAKNAEKKGN